MPELDEEERGTAGRGTENRSGRIMKRRYALPQDPSLYPEAPSISAYRGAPISVAEEMAVAREIRDLEAERKEEFKEENPKWAWSHSVQSQANKQGIYFTDEEIREEVGDWLNLHPGTQLAGVVMDVVNVVRQQYPSLEAIDEESAGTLAQDLSWQALQLLAAVIAERVVMKKLHAKQAKALLEEVLEKSGLNKRLAKALAREILEMQRIAHEVFQHLDRSNPGWRNDEGKRLAMGKVQEDLMNERFKSRNRRRTVQVRFQVASGVSSGKFHRGPRIDYEVFLSVKNTAIVELKLSSNAISAFRDPEKTIYNSQLFAQALSARQGTPTFYLTPEEIILVPKTLAEVKLSKKAIQQILTHVQVLRD